MFIRNEHLYKQIQIISIIKAYVIFAVVGQTFVMRSNLTINTNVIAIVVNLRSCRLVKQRPAGGCNFNWTEAARWLRSTNKTKTNQERIRQMWRRPHTHTSLPHSCVNRTYMFDKHTHAAKVKFKWTTQNKRSARNYLVILAKRAISK